MGPGAPLRIVHVDAESGFSGGEVQVLLLVDALARCGHASALVCPPGAALVEHARTRALELRAAPMRGDLDVPGVRALRRALRDLRPDVVHLHTGRATWLGGLAARGLGVAVVATRRQERRVRRGWRTRLVYGRLVRRVVAISAAVERCLVDGGVDARRIVRIPDAVDAERVRPRRARDEVRAELGVAPEHVALLALGALVRRKGIDVLLDALARSGSDGWRLVVAGDGAERAALERRAADAGLAERVRFLGARSDVGDLLGAADALVMPSRAEGMGTSALEAMAAGRAVVASDVGGLAETVVDGRTGLLVPPDDPARLADSLARLVGDRALLARLGAAGPARVAEGFDADQQAAAYEALYRAVLAETGR